MLYCVGGIAASEGVKYLPFFCCIITLHRSKPHMLLANNSNSLKTKKAFIFLSFKKINANKRFGKKGWSLRRGKRTFPCILLSVIAAAPFGENGIATRRSQRWRAAAWQMKKLCYGNRCVISLDHEKNTRKTQHPILSWSLRSFLRLCVSSVTVLFTKVVNTILNIKFV